jgi:hypothetical protein
MAEEGIVTQPTASQQASPQLVTVFDALDTVPDEIRNYLLSDGIGTKRTEVYDAHKLAEEEKDIALATELDVFFGNVTLLEFPDMLWSRLPWKDDDEARAVALSIDILGRVMLPAEAYLGDVEAVIRELGGDPNVFPQERLQMRRLTHEAGAKEIVEGLGPMDSDSLRRAVSAVESFLRGVRKEHEMMGALTKSKKVGGAGLTEDQAMTVLAQIQHNLKTTVYSDETKKVVPAEAAPLPQEYTPERIRQIFVGTQAEQEMLRERLTDMFGEEMTVDITLIRDKFYATLFPEDKPQPETWSVVACLVRLAQMGTEQTTLAVDKRFQDVARKYLAEQDRKTDIELMETESDHPRVMNIFLQLLLRRFARLDENESARFGLQVINLMRKRGITKYGDLVVFDLELGKFRWVALEPM